ncbi:Xap-5-like protein [Schizosaccharomyces pombe]
MSGHTDADEIHEILRNSTTGLVHLKDYQRVKQNIVEKREKHALSTTSTKIKKKKDALSKKVKQGIKVNKGKLSFGEDEELENDDLPLKKVEKKMFMGKDPSADTSFLPDAEREIRENAKRAEYRKQWLKEQEQIREKEILIPFIYYDGTSTTYHVRTRLKDSVGHFLADMKQQIPFLKRILDMDKFLLVQSDLIIPHHHELYYFYINKVQGRDGLLFDFDKLSCSSPEMVATTQLPSQCIPHLVQKSYYLQNRHVFPCVHWEVFDSRKDYSLEKHATDPNAALFYRPS